MNPYATIRKALEAAIEYPNSTHAELKAHDALTALAELERAAGAPVAYQYAHPYFGRGTVWREERHWNGHTSDESRALYAAPPIPAPQPQVAVTDDMCERVFNSELPNKKNSTRIEIAAAREWLTAWQSELGPALGMVNASAERERICAAIKATDDAASECDYMLDSNDCIAVVRGELGPSNFAAREVIGGWK